MTQIKVDTVTNAAGTGNPDFADGLTYEGSATSTLNLCQYTSSASEPSSPKNGALWYDTANSVTKIYVNNAWNELTPASAGGSVWYGDRGVIAGSGTYTIQYIDITTTGNATDFGDLSFTRESGAAFSDGTYGVFAGGYGSGGNYNEIDYVTISTLGNAADFGDLTVGRDDVGGLSNSTRGVVAGGRNTSNTTTNIIDYVTIATTGNATDFGDLITAKKQFDGGASDGTYGVFGSGNTTSESLDYITIDTTGNATLFGYDNAITDFGNTRAESTTTSDTTRGLIAGGGQTVCNDITYFTIATTGNTTDFGDLTRTHRRLTSVSNASYAIFCGGFDDAFFRHNTMDYVTIQTTGNASDFGDLLEADDQLFGTSGAAS